MKKIMTLFGAMVFASTILTGCGDASKDNDKTSESFSTEPIKADSRLVNNNEEVKVSEKEEIIDTLFFTDGSGKYKLIINGAELKIIYQYLEDEEMKPELASLKNKKIIVPNNRTSYEGQKTDDVYKIVRTKLCVYNPEEDLDNCYEFIRKKSTADLESFFK